MRLAVHKANGWAKSEDARLASQPLQGLKRQAGPTRSLIYRYHILRTCRHPHGIMIAEVLTDTFYSNLHRNTDFVQKVRRADAGDL